nr:uncharacterized mitochondrial protein AtMg00810-like [Tanacetum cinerariifolium]
DAPESSGNSNPTATSTNLPADHMETLAVETPIPTVSSPVPTAYLNDSPELSIYQIDVKSAFLYGTIDEEVYVMQPPGFQDSEFPARVYKVEKAMGTIDQTLFIRRKRGDFILVQVYVDDIILGSLNPHLCREFKALMHEKFQMSAMGELNFFLGLQVLQKKDGIFLSQDKLSVPCEALSKEISSSILLFNESKLKDLLKFLTFEPPGFQDSDFPARVYKVEKAMYGLHQAPRAWYGTLSKYLLINGFQRGRIDQTLFIKRQRGNFILVQIYMDDIIFESSNPQLCREFEALMHENFQMSTMGELSFFLGLLVLQKEDGIFLSQDKYVGDILKKFRYLKVRSANTPMDKENPWGKDGTRKDVELHLYRSMIGSLMYLTASRPDIMFAVCAYARHQVTPKECHLHAVKRIFRYLKGHPKLELSYPKESPFDLVAYSDSDYGGATQDRKSTTGGCQFLDRRLISWQCKKQTIVATSTIEA